MNTERIVDTNEETLQAALAAFGWTCTPQFFERYYTDAWVFNLANAVEKLTAALQVRDEEIARAARLIEAQTASLEARGVDLRLLREQLEVQRRVLLTRGNTEGETS